MYRILAFLVLVSALLAEGNFRLFLKDGTHHLVREYSVQGDRVRYYSVERSDWEEIPAELVDLRRTEKIRQERAAEEKDRRAADQAEETAEREIRKEIERIPVEPGVYLTEGEKITALTASEMKVTTSKGRKVLQVLAPIPIIPGKGTVEVDGERSKTILPLDRPEFFVRIGEELRFSIVRMKPKKGARIVETLQIIPVANETIEERDEVPVFRHQVAPDLFKLWPQSPLEPGEYAVIVFREGKVELQVFDFARR